MNTDQSTLLTFIMADFFVSSSSSSSSSSGTLAVEGTLAFVDDERKRIATERLGEQAKD